MQNGQSTDTDSIEQKSKNKMSNTDPTKNRVKLGDRDG